MLRHFARAKQKIDFWEQYEVVFAMAQRNHDTKLRRLLRQFIEPREFWSYYGAARPRERMPVRHYDNVPLMRRIVGLSFGEIATRRDIPLLHRMLEHPYWPVYHGASNALARVNGDKELAKLIARAVRRAESDAAIRGLLDAVCALDHKLFGKLPQQLPIETAFGETRAEF